MGRIKQALRVLFHQKDPQKQEAQKESARVQALKKQIGTLCEINETLNEQVRHYAKQQRATQKVSMEERALDMVVNMFAPNQAPPTPIDITTTSENPTFDNIKRFVDSLPDGVKKASAKVPLETFSSIAKQKDPSLTDAVIEQAYNYILEQYTEV